jgi:putative oxidoreductase
MVRNPVPDRRAPLAEGPNMSHAASTPITMSAESVRVAKYAPLVGRLLIAPLFLLSGIGKITAPAATIGMMQAVGLPLPTFGFLLAIAIEIGGSICLILGYRARLIASVMAIFTLATALIFHTQFGDQNQLVHFLKNIALVGGLLQIVGFGAGAYSRDARQR